MRHLLNPKWLFFVNTLPLIVLFLLLAAEYEIIKSLLTYESKEFWAIFCGALFVSGLLNILYGLYLVRKKKTVPLFYGIFLVFWYAIFLILYGAFSSEMFPLVIPRWMLPGNPFLYMGIFIMPTLAYGLFTSVLRLTSEIKAESAWYTWKNFLFTLAIPLSWFVYFQILLPLWKIPESKYQEFVLIVMLTISTFLFFFFLVRGIYLLVSKKSGFFQKYQLTWKIPATILLPLLGLALNNGLVLKPLGISIKGFFGDFQNPWFYVLALVNGILVCLPSLENKKYRLALFAGRCFSLAYTLYFFFVFLPFLPLSIIAIIAFGAGFLMLAPPVLFIVHLGEIANDVQFLKNHFSKRFLLSLSMASFILLPGIISARFIADKMTLHKTLEYVYAPDYSKTYDIDRSSLSRTLEAIRFHKKSKTDSAYEEEIPFISFYFQWLVLDNMTLSNTKINFIEKIFFGKSGIKLAPEKEIKNDVRISDIYTRSFYDEAQGAWISRVDLELTNHENQAAPSEYVTKFELPPGCWISGYDLHIGDKKEPGILTERKSAMWVYSQIRNERRDPGILYYLTGNAVAFRVYPFSKDETRKTGIEFIHKDPVSLLIDGHTVNLGSGDIHHTRAEKNPVQDVVYISAPEKKNLPPVQRRPEYHFIVDTSTGNGSLKDDYIRRIESFIKKNPVDIKKVKVIFSNTYATPGADYGNWQQKLREQTFEGGFYLDRSLKTILAGSFQKRENSYPLIVVVSGAIQNAIIENDFLNFTMTFPEGDTFYSIDSGQILRQHSLTRDPLRAIPVTRIAGANPVLAWPDLKNPAAYLPDDNQAGIVLAKPGFSIDEGALGEKKWQSGLLMQGKWMDRVLNPQTSQKDWLSLVRYSFISKIMNPYTSYMAVENEAQKAVLKRKQEEVLSGNKSLDPGEDTQKMSEPGFWVLALLLGIAYALKTRRKKRV